MFDLAGIDITMIRSVLPPTARVLAAARKAGLKVVYLKMGYRPDLSDLGSPDSPNWIKHSPMRVGETIPAPDGTEGRILIRDTWNTDIVDELRPESTDIVLYKTRYSGFYQTDLDAVLRRLNAKYLAIAGCTTSVCVESTIRDAMFRDYCCLLLADCTAEPIGYSFPRSNYDASLLVIQALFGWVSRAEQFIEAMEARPAVALGSAEAG